MKLYVSVEPLVVCLEPEKVCGRAHCSRGTFSEPMDVGGVIRACPNGLFSHVRNSGNSVMVHYVTTELQIAVIDRAGRVIVGD